MKKLEISYEVADGITLANLQECRKYHKSELKKKKERSKVLDSSRGSGTLCEVY